MNATRIGWSLAIPNRAPAAVVVCLHGAFEDHRFAFADIHLHDVVAEAKAPLVVASVDGGSRSYWHKRTNGLDPQAMLLDEFLPLVDEAVGAKLPKVLLGWSMGGYGAVLIAERHPEEFVGFCAASPGLWATYAEAKPAAFDGRADYDANNVFDHLDRVRHLKSRVDCGIWDPFIGESRRLAAALGYPAGGFGPGYHDDAYWRSIAPGQIASIAEWVR
jgi:enterochelin esterase-like enzyme